MSSNALGAIVVGTGFGVITHLRALREAGFEVLALVGRNPEKTAERAKRAGVPQGLTSLDEALALPGVDVVSVATPPHTHCEIVTKAVLAGKHVMCEKPFARNAEEAQRMLDAAEKAGVVHMLGTEFRWATAQAVAGRAIRAGAIGEPRLATFMLQMPGLADPSGEVPGWWASAAEGGGWLGAYASHVLDQICDWFGEIEGLSASLGQVAQRDWDVEDSFTIHFRTRSGCDGVLQSSTGAMGPGLGATRVAGTEGTLWVEGADVKVADKAGVRTLEVPDDLINPAPNPPDGELLVTAYDMLHSMGIDLGPFTKLFEVMAGKIRGESVPEDPRAGTFVDGVMQQKLLDAVRRSSAEKVWVTID
jgi:predicted dehydrogenase